MKLSHAVWGHPRWAGMVERSDTMWSTGEGNGKSFQYSRLENPVKSMKGQNDRILKEECLRLVGVAQMVKCLSTMWETRVQSLGWEDPLRRKWQSTPVLLPGKSHGQRSLVGYSVRGHKESDTTE